MLIEAKTEERRDYPKALVVNTFRDAHGLVQNVEVKLVDAEHLLKILATLCIEKVWQTNNIVCILCSVGFYVNLLNVVVMVIFLHYVINMLFCNLGAEC